MLPSRSLLSDTSLSACARLIGAYAASLKGGWFGSPQTLADALGYTTRSIRRGVSELVEAGWAERTERGFRMRTHDEVLASGAPSAARIAKPASGRTSMSGVRTPMSASSSLEGFYGGRRHGGGASSSSDGPRARLVGMVAEACEGLDVGPPVVTREAVETFEIALACDGEERVRRLIQRTARDASDGSIPRHYWTRLWIGGGYAARRKAIAEVDAAEARARARREEPVPEGEQQEMSFEAGAQILQGFLRVVYGGGEQSEVG